MGVIKGDTRSFYYSSYGVYGFGVRAEQLNVAEKRKSRLIDPEALNIQSPQR